MRAKIVLTSVLAIGLVAAAPKRTAPPTLAIPPGAVAGHQDGNNSWMMVSPVGIFGY
jgi:hypothetical protein